jgi:hypothetical protein
MKCESCHAEKGKGIMPFEELGYPVDRVKDLRNLEELKMVKGREITGMPYSSGAAISARQ